VTLGLGAGWMASSSLRSWRRSIAWASRWCTAGSWTRTIPRRCVPLLTTHERPPQHAKAHEALLR
jgi:hypothetical protein